MKSGDKFQEKPYPHMIGELKIKLIEYLGHDIWKIHCRFVIGGDIKYYYGEITGADIIEYYYKISEA